MVQNDRSRPLNSAMRRGAWTKEGPRSAGTSTDEKTTRKRTSIPAIWHTERQVGDRVGDREMVPC